MTIKEFRAVLEERIEDLLTGDEDEELLLTFGKIAAYQTVLENYIKKSDGYVPKHGRE